MSEATDLEIISRPFEQRAETVLTHVYRGMHHCPEITKLPNRWSVNHYGDLSTFDFNDLTRLVVSAHDQCIRASVQCSGPRMVKIVLWNRQYRDGNFSDRHPTMEQSIAEIRGIKP